MNLSIVEKWSLGMVTCHASPSDFVFIVISNLSIVVDEKGKCEVLGIATLDGRSMFWELWCQSCEIMRCNADALLMHCFNCKD
jgi:hypothetical protein